MNMYAYIYEWIYFICMYAYVLYKNVSMCVY